MSGELLHFSDDLCFKEITFVTKIFPTKSITAGKIRNSNVMSDGMGVLHLSQIIILHVNVLRDENFD